MQVLQSPCDNEAKFRVLVGIGSLVSAGQLITRFHLSSLLLFYFFIYFLVQAVIDKALVVSSAQPSDLSSLIQPLCSVVEPAKV